MSSLLNLGAQSLTTMILGGGLGNRLVLMNNMILMAAAGAVGVDEKYSAAASSAQNADALNAMVFPSLTDWGRIGVELEANLCYELSSDFFIGLDGSCSRDSRPPTEAASRQDYCLTTSIHWGFH